MDSELKKLFKNLFKTSIGILIFGVVIREASIYVAMFLGSLISILSLYMMYKNAEYIVHDGANPLKNAIGAYAKRYLIYGFFLWAMIQVDLSWMVAGLLGLLSLKFNIFLRTLSIYLKHIKDKFKI